MRTESNQRRRCTGRVRHMRDAIAFLIALSLGWSTQAGIPQAQDQKTYQEAVQAFQANMHPDGCTQILADGPALAGNPHFNEINRADQIGILGWMADCGIKMQALRVALDALGRLTTIMPENDQAWRWRLLLGIQLEEASEAVHALQSWSEINPKGISLVTTQQLAFLLNQVRNLPDGDAIRLQIYGILADANYTSPESLNRTDWMRVEHARLLLGQNHIEEAIDRLTGVVGVQLHIEMGADRLFDPVRGALGDIDLAALAKSEIEDAISDVNLNPRLLQARYLLLQAYAQANRMSEALQTANSALAAVAEDPAQFDDTAEYENWLHNDRAYLLYAMGRNDEALDAMRAAAAIKEQGQENVSQIINLAEILVYEGLPEEALETLASMGQASDFGGMWANSTRACAAVQTGNESMLEEALDYLREHETENVAALQQALLCSGLLEDAAALYVKRLADPQTRGPALLALQRWDHDPLENLSFRKMLLDRLDAVRDRPEVQAAIDSVGRIQHLPFARFYWGSL